MILLDTGTVNARAFSSLVQFARQLSAAGLPVVIDETTAPTDLDRTQKYEAAPFLTDVDLDRVDHVLIAGAQDISPQVQEKFYNRHIKPDTRITAMGYFETAQSLIGAQSKLAYVLGREPEMFDLAGFQNRPLLTPGHAPQMYTPMPDRAQHPKPGILIYVPKKLLKRHHWLSQLERLATQADFSCSVITEAQGKDRIRRSNFSSIPVFSYGEMAPDTLAQLADIAIFFGENIPGERMAALALNLWGAGGTVVDCTTRGAFAATGAPAIRGPGDIIGLDGFLSASILPNLTSIGTELQSNTWLQAHSLDRLLDALGIHKPDPTPQTEPPRTLFVPTNGVGLGHAQRCSLIAEAMGPPDQLGFAAFPSCLPMLQGRGFDCLPLVSKSDQHVDPYANDLLTYLRLRQATGPQDHLVFDGGYVFDSIYRTILENRLRATWIRRGLWQPGQLDQTPLERERAFHQVIVPQEAFDELNSDYSFGEHIHRVGPIVRQSRQNKSTRTALRDTLARQFGHSVEKLVVTLLGGGVAADRSTQLQNLAAQFSEHPNCLHLIVVWPNARVSASLFGWPNTQVVRTMRALELCQASDFVISAAGYNSFHELLYHGVPTVFIPQMASYMDDQNRRSQAAADRGLAATVPADELLTLRQAVNDFLTGNRPAEIQAALRATQLPETGTQAAADLIKGGTP